VGWAILYGDYEIYPAVVPLCDGQRGIVGFTPLARVYVRGDRDRLVVEIGPSNLTFQDATAATRYILYRAKGMIDGDERALA